MTSTLAGDEITLGDYQITTVVTDAVWRQNCYLICHLPSGEQALIDPGEDDGHITTAINSHSGELRFILLTHGHHDHVGAVAGLSRQFGVPCRLHRNDVRLLHHAPMYAWRFAQKKIEFPGPYIVLEDMPDLRLGGQSIEVLHTPGHTSGSVCYGLEEVVFTGDTLLYQHMGRIDLPGSDAQLIKPSIQTLIKRLPPDTVVLPGHGRPWNMREAQHWWASAVASLPLYMEPSA